MFRYTFIFLFLFPLSLSANQKIIVKDQNDFNRLNTELTEALVSSIDDIEVIIRPRTYYYTNNHIKLGDHYYPQRRITFNCSGANIISKGVIYKNGDVYNERFNVNNAYISGENKLVSLWGTMKRAEGLVEVLDEETKLCRVKCLGVPDMSEQEAHHVRIKIPHWFRTSYYKVSKIKGEYIYFYVNDLKKGYKKGWNINDDNNYGHQTSIRFSLCNVKNDSNNFGIINGIVSLPYSCGEVYECISKQLIVVKNSHFKEVRITGLNVMGSSWYLNYLIEFNNVKTKSIQIEKCIFSCIQSDVISFTNTPNAIVKECFFQNCYRGCVYSDIDSPNTLVSNCRFENVGLAFENSKAVRCEGANYSIINNTFENFGYCAIFLGYGKTRNENQLVSGVVEYNTLLFTNDYIDLYKNDMLMDGGAIYVMTQNDKAVIRYNYVSGYTGMKDNRGVFCDDGAYNVDIYGNIITNISNSYCIDSRRASSIEKSGKRGANVIRTNVNNRIFDNLIEGRIRFAAREGEGNGCILGMNYFLLSEGSNLQNIYTCLDTEGKDVTVEYRGIQEGKLCVSKKDYNNLRKSKSWRFFKKHVRK